MEKLLRKFGLSEVKFVEDLNELRESKLNMVIVKSIKNFNYKQNDAPQVFKKGNYVMSFGIFNRLHKEGKLKLLKPAGMKFHKIYRPYVGQDLNNKSLLVSRTGGIGDLLFIQPNLIELKKRYPSCKIIFATGPSYHSMIDNWDCVDKVIDIPHTVNHFIGADYHAYFEGVIERCKEAHTTNCYNLMSRWMGLALPDELLVPKQTPKEDKVEFCKDWLEQRKIDKFILFQMRASSPIRTPDPKVFKSIINGLNKEGYKVIITDTPRNASNVDSFIRFATEVYNFAEYSKTLDYSIALASLAECVVSTDSSFIHIAASLDRPCFGLYGPFPGSIRLTTYKNCDWVDAKKKCAPCYLHGNKPCRHKSNCYNNIDTDECIERIKKLIQ